jgi:hypothetical protein
VEVEKVVRGRQGKVRDHDGICVSAVLFGPSIEGIGLRRAFPAGMRGTP